MDCCEDFPVFVYKIVYGIKNAFVCTICNPDHFCKSMQVTDCALFEQILKDTGNFSNIYCLGNDGEKKNKVHHRHGGKRDTWKYLHKHVEQEHTNASCFESHVNTSTLYICI